MSLKLLCNSTVCVAPVELQSSSNLEFTILLALFFTSYLTFSTRS
jgi:hypothetical protein